VPTIINTIVIDFVPWMLLYNTRYIWGNPPNFYSMAKKSQLSIRCSNGSLTILQLEGIGLQKIQNTGVNHWLLFCVAIKLGIST